MERKIKTFFKGLFRNRNLNNKIIYIFGFDKKKTFFYALKQKPSSVHYTSINRYHAKSYVELTSYVHFYLCFEPFIASPFLD